MVKIYKQPFAHGGDAIAIPDVSQPDGKMSSADGWTVDYQLPKTDPNYKPVGRQEMNGVFKEVTEALGQVQVQGSASWSPDGAPYPINAQAYHNGKQWLALRANSVEPVEGEDWTEFRSLSLRKNIEVTVGAGGDFDTINAALMHLSQSYPTYLFNGFDATIKLKAGFAMNEQVLLRNGVNLSWVNIVSEDSVVPIVRSALTVSTYSIDQTKEQNNPRILYPAFTAIGRSALPKISTLFEMDDSGVASQRIGIFLGEESSGHIEADCGIIRAGGNGVELFRSSLTARGAKLDHAGGSGIYLYSSSDAELSFATADHCGVMGIYAAEGSNVSCRGASAQYAGDCGLKVHHGGYANALYANFSYAQGDAGVYGRHAAVIDADTITVNGCVGHGIYSLFGGMIDAASSTITGNGNGVLAEHGGEINVSNGATVTDNLQHNIWATNGGKVNAASSDIRRAGDNGVQCSTGSFVNATNCDARLAGNHAAGVAQTGEIRAYNITYTNGKETSQAFNTPSGNGGVIWGSRAT